MKTKYRLISAGIVLCLLLAVVTVISVPAATVTYWDDAEYVSMAWYENVNVSSGITYEYDFDSDGTAETYYLTGYSDQVFIIESEAELAGVAALVNAGSGEHRNDDIFDGCTFKIVNNLDLTGHNWTPIGKTNNHTFSGTIVGALGGVAGASVTITNMTVAHDNNGGLVGTQDGGGIENITVTNSTVSTTLNSVGTFVGYVRDRAATYKNLKSSADVVGNHTANTKDSPAGGLAGNCNFAGTLFENCEFTGTVANASKQTGGVIGYAQNGVTVKNCNIKAEISVNHTSDGLAGGVIGRADVAATEITGCILDVTVKNLGVGRTGGMIGYAANGATVTDCTVKGSVLGNTADTAKGGVGGVIGLQRGTANISKVNVLASITGANANGAGGIIGFQDKNNSVANITECYVGSTLSGTVRVAGFIGAARAVNNLKDCHFDGIVLASHTQNGAFIGRYDAVPDGTSTLTMENCLNTGVAKNTRAAKNAFSWVGHSGQGSNGASIYNVKNCYSNSDIPFAAWLDASSSGNTYTTTWTVNEWDASASAYTQKVRAESGATDSGALISYKPTLVSLENMNEATLKGFDFTDVWTVRTGKLPVLISAGSNTVDTYAEADLSWFSNTAAGNKSFSIENEADMLGLIKLSKIIPAGTGYTVNIADGLMKPTSDKIAQTWIDAMKTGTGNTGNDTQPGDGNTSGGSQTQKPDDETQGPLTVPTRPSHGTTQTDTVASEQTEQAPADEGGCGSAIAVSALITVGAVALAGAMMARKKQD